MVSRIFVVISIVMHFNQSIPPHDIDLPAYSLTRKFPQFFLRQHTIDLPHWYGVAIYARFTCDISKRPYIGFLEAVQPAIIECVPRYHTGIRRVQITVFIVENLQELNPALGLALAGVFS